MSVEQDQTRYVWLFGVDMFPMWWTFYWGKPTQPGVAVGFSASLN